MNWRGTSHNMFFEVFTPEMLWTLGLIFLIMFKSALKMRQDLLEDELLYSFMEKTDKEVLLELLKRANLDWDEWNDYMLTFDGGYIEATFDKEGNLRDIRSRAE